MSFKNKRILVVCKETYSYPLYFLVKKWIKDNIVGAFFFNPVETLLDKCLLNDTTYYKFSEIKGLQMFTSNDIASILKETEKMPEADLLEKIEKQYSHYGNLNFQIVSSQYLTRHYHYRNYIRECNYIEQLNWIILNYKNIETIIEEFKPDIIIDTDSAELARCVLREICYCKNIPYISLDYPRYEMYITPTYNLGIHVSKQFKSLFDIYSSYSSDKLISEFSYIEKFRERSSIMAERFKDDVTSQYKPDGIIRTFKNLVGKMLYFLKQDLSGHNKKIKKENSLLCNKSYEYIKFYSHYYLLKQRLMRRNKYFLPPKEGEKYLYMPLHLIPESTTFTLSPFYINELTIIEAVSKSLPAGWWLYVKEHQAMIGERPLSFYKAVNRLTNVKMVQINYYTDPKPWISNSQGVITISGTSAFEAALLCKPAIVFSDVIFNIIEGIKRCTSFEQLPLLISQMSVPLNNMNSCAAYIRAVKEYGYPINIKYLMSEGERILRESAEMTNLYRENIENLERLYLDAYKSFCNYTQNYEDKHNNSNI